MRRIYDGTGQKPFLGDVLVRNDRIAEVGQNLEVPEDTGILEADGKLLCPGFIDIHRHADVQPLLNSKSEAELRQGVTTAVSRTRGFLGAFSRFLRECAFERHVVTPEDAIYKMAFAPAKRFSFTDREKIANGATKLLGEEIGIPSRSAVGMNVLPGNLPIEIEVIFELYE